jgi:outer membrane immunogenic protein
MFELHLPVIGYIYRGHQMKKLLLSTAVLALTAGAALAADLPTRKEPLLPAPPPPPLWTGFYAGLNAGYGFGTNSNTQSVAYGSPWGVSLPAGFIGDHPAASLTVLSPVGYALSSNGSNNQSGFIGGAQFGYNYQWGQNVVIGIETDIQGTGIRAGSFGAGLGQSGWDHPPIEGVSPFGIQQTAFGGTSVSAGLDYLGTVRGRIGYLWTPTMLLYATGGFTYGGAYANVHNYANSTWTASIEGVGLPGSLNQTYVGGGNRNSILTGWNVGGGLEWMFMPNWSLKAEGIYYNLGNMNVATAAFGPSPLTLSLPGNGQVASILNGAFGPGGTAIGATRVNYQGVIARVGVNYHFNWGAAAPIVAKY